VTYVPLINKGLAFHPLPASPSSGGDEDGGNCKRNSLREVWKHMGGLNPILKAIDSLSIGCGKLVAWIVIPNVLALVYEFVARYLLGRPTIWSYEITYFLYGSHFLLGAAYTLHLKSHIRIDILYQHVQPRGQAIIDTVGYLVFFFPVMLILIYAGTEFVIQSFEMGEKSGLSPWRPILYPFKAVVVFAIFLLFLQGIAEFIRSVSLGIRGKDL
jgi:TRAP-type mannitol/chloroaromatic compound transport system permease small subunit